MSGHYEGYQNNTVYLPCGKLFSTELVHMHSRLYQQEMN
jgi:hypothetical protein